MRPKVTVYITCHNYGRFVREAIDSVYRQFYDDWELLIIDDGSSDDSWSIIGQAAAEMPGKVRTYRNAKAKGLPTCANLAISEARGKYLLRLDADDYLDESALLIMATYLERNNAIALVYPNYIYVEEDGTYIGVEQRKRVETETKLLDLPAHGACTMVRKRILKAVGGYSTDHRAQDGYDLWFNIINRYRVANISTPLFYYRQHRASLTQNTERVLAARRKIKKSAVKRYEGEVGIRLACVIPARNTHPAQPNVCLEKINGKPLIEYAIETALECQSIEHILLTSDDQRVLDHCARFSGLILNLRSLELSQSQVKIIEVMRDAISHLEDDYEIFPDALVMMNVHTPLLRSENVEEAINTLILHDVDSVTSVYEDSDLHFQHGEYGLTPLNTGAMNQLQLEREKLFVDNNALKVFWRDVLAGENLYGQTYGHVVMPREQSLVLTDDSMRWMIEETLRRHQSTAAE
ncbi:MAG: glycosyltransferase [Rhodospirillales bacterium]